MENEEKIQFFAKRCSKVFEEIRKDMVGQDDIVEGTVIAMIAGGNVLLEGVPGIGKTRLVRIIARVFDLPFSRIQFTPDLMPADITGTNVITKDENGRTKLSFQAGPIFSNIILADEINRATPKTQSALLEAMQEHTVTIAGETRKLDEPFFVLATQNPIEQDGTYTLPEAQMDRFMLKLVVKNPTLSELCDIVKMTQETMDETASSVLSGEELLIMTELAKTIPIAEDVLNYTIKLVAATHPETENASQAANKYVKFGSSPRGAQSLITGAKVRALIYGRYNVSYDDINTLALPILRHRIKLNFDAITSKVTSDDVITSIIEELNSKSTSIFGQIKDIGRKENKKQR